jgi:hypothetical protein
MNTWQVTVGKPFSATGLVRALRAKKLSLWNLKVLKKITPNPYTASITLVEVAVKDLTGNTNECLTEKEFVESALASGFYQVPYETAAQILLQAPDPRKINCVRVVTESINCDGKTLRFLINGTSNRPSLGMMEFRSDELCPPNRTFIFGWPNSQSMPKKFILRRDESRPPITLAQVRASFEKLVNSI